MKPLLLIIDDDKEFVYDFVILLESEFICIAANDELSGLEMLKKKNPDVILLDLMFEGGKNGIEILKQIKKIDKNIPVIMITDYASVNTAIDAIKIGAVDYISKTPNLEELKIIIRKSLEQRMQLFRSEAFQSEISKNFKEIIGSSSEIKNVKNRIQIYSENINTVLISGESGVGKELVARQIHNLSNRKTNPFIAVNCAALPKDLLESELFGHERGAFTGAEKRKPGKFEIAEHGTIFLDEISELTLDAQVKLLRVLQEKEFERVGGINTIKTDARVIAATNKNLKQLVQEGKFREDLYYRLDVLPLFVPPLRNRKDDIAELVEFFMNRCAVELNLPQKKISSEMLNLFQQYDWPGNIRELQNYVTRLMIIPGEHVDDELHKLSIGANSLENKIEKIPETWEEMDKMRKQAADRASRIIEKIFLENILKKFDGNVSKTAEYIGINRTNLHKMMRKCGF